MEGFIRSGPLQLPQAKQAAREAFEGLRGFRPARVLLAGMGGSALGAGIVESLDLSSGQPLAGRFSVCRDYAPPLPPGEDCLTICISYSGGTEETLSAWKTAGESSGRVVAVASGGDLLEKAAAAGHLTVEIPPQAPGFQPRFSLYFTAGFMLELLRLMGWLEFRPELELLSAQLLERMDEARFDGMDIAEAIGDRIPVIYTGARLEAGLARLWRIKMNENVKIPAIYGSIPEVNHNEMIGFGEEGANRFVFLLLQDEGLHPRVARRFELMEQVMGELGYRVMRRMLPATTTLAVIFDSLLVADWTTMHLAKMKRIDPVSIPVIQRFKALMGPMETGNG